MPNIKSAKKRMLTSEKSRIANKSMKSRVNSTRRKLDEAVAAGDKEKGQELLVAYASALDKAAKKGAVKANTASRSKSRATIRVNAI